MSRDSVINAFPGKGHNHKACMKSALSSAEAACEQKGVRLTKLRRRVLALVLVNHAPVKAYDLLDQLKAEHAGAAPPTVYRALDFLVGEGLIHRIESLNAFIGCGGPEEAHQSQFLICRECGQTAELADADIGALLREKAEKLGFEIDRTTIEMSGRCPRCR